LLVWGELRIPHLVEQTLQGVYGENGGVTGGSRQAT
jgi:hypothetical protein